jgi:D-threo-aldose 1-dehydrogenase
VRDVFVPAVGIRIPVVGFGCGSLTGTSRKDALQLLGKAYDAGVRHFDVARSYGYGQAEKILGTFVKSRRAEVTITTKFGIQPPGRTSPLGVAVQIGRWVVRLLPSTRKALQRRTQTLTKSGGFSVSDARISLDTSLRELGTDSIDFFLLHDYVVNNHPADKLASFLEGAVKAGKVRAFGIGTGINNVVRALESQPKLCNVVQFENSILKENMCSLPPRVAASRLVITHGALQSYRLVSSFLAAHTNTAKDWSRRLGVDCLQEDTISALLLNYAVEANPHGLVLFSSMKSVRVTKNVKAVLEPGFSPTQVALFGQLVQRELRPLPSL